MDSGRGASETYETSASSVTSGSSTNHSNRLNSTASNCSGDSGAGTSLGMGEKETLEPLQEGREVEGGGVYESLRSLSRASCSLTERSRIYEVGAGGSVYGVLSKKNSREPPSVPPRFATIRKSFTLPVQGVILNPGEGEFDEQQEGVVEPQYLNFFNRPSITKDRPRPSSLFVLKRHMQGAGSLPATPGDQGIYGMSSFLQPKSCSR